MARNVSEPELDALLGHDEEPRASVLARDFREPKRLSAADLEALQRPLESTATAVLETVRLVVPAEIVLDPIEVGEATLDSILDDDGQEIVGALGEGAAGPSVVYVDASASVGIAELALGADEGESPAARALTALEKTLIDRLVVRVLERAAQSLGLTLKDTRGFASRSALNRELGQDGDRRRLACRIPLVIGPSRVVIHLLLAGVKVPAPKSAPVVPATKDTRKSSIPPELAPTHVDVCAVLSRTDILLTELLALEVGDVITLDTKPGEDIALEIEGQPRARVHFGARDGRLAVRIQEILRNKTNR